MTLLEFGFAMPGLPLSMQRLLRLALHGICRVRSCNYSVQFVRTCEYSTKARLHISRFPEHVNKPAPLVTWAAPASRDKDAVLSEHASHAATRRKRIQHRVAPACVILDLVDSRNRRTASVLTTLLNWTVRTSSGTSSSRAKGYVEEIPGRKALNTVMTSCLASMIVHVSCVVPDTLTERFGS